MNASRAKGSQLRVLLGDPPIDWDTIRNGREHFEWIKKQDTLPAEVVAREVLAQRRRALILYGSMRLQRRNVGFQLRVRRDGRHMEDQFDALLYLGPQAEPSPQHDLSPGMCADTAYMKMLLARAARVRLKREFERLEGYCAKVAPK